jgi:hypothetical protein
LGLDGDRGQVTVVAVTAVVAVVVAILKKRLGMEEEDVGLNGGLI